MLTIEHLTLDQAAADPGLLDRLLAGQQTGVILRGFLPPDVPAAVLDAALAGHLPGLDPGHYTGRNYGPTLIVSGPDLTPYFGQADALASLTAAGVDLEQRLREVLSALAPGRQVRRPVHASGRSYAPMGLRMLAPGGTIRLHCENETAAFPAMADLTPQTARLTTLSFYTPLALPEAGGELEVYPLRYAEGPGAALNRMDRAGPQLEALLAQHPPTIARAAVGDLLIFDAGRHYHRVTPVQGDRPRWTLGGFLAPAADGRALYHWN